MKGLTFEKINLCCLINYFLCFALDRWGPRSLFQIYTNLWFLSESQRSPFFVDPKRRPYHNPWSEPDIQISWQNGDVIEQSLFSVEKMWWNAPGNSGQRREALRMEMEGDRDTLTSFPSHSDKIPLVGVKKRNNRSTSFWMRLMMNYLLL